MTRDLGVIFLTVACFQVALTTDPAAIAYADFKDRNLNEAFQRSHLANSLIDPQTAVLARYLNNEGAYNISPPHSSCACLTAYVVYCILRYHVIHILT